MKSQVEDFVARQWAVPRELVTVDVQAIHGGLESAVALATITTDPRYPSVPRSLVVKALTADGRREAAVYDLLWSHLDQPPAARLLAAEPAGTPEYLFLEDVQCVSDWPWTDTGAAAAVCRTLARLHDSPALPPSALSWDYETALARSAGETLALASSATDERGLRCWSRLGELRTVIAALPQIRERLLQAGTALIHGDVHPGNVMIRRDERGLSATLIDWGRARIGSPMEDVASWLQSVGCWEPEARRRHDTLLRIYLDSRREPRTITSELRTDYWFASVSNGLAGAIRYHVAVVCDRSCADRLRAQSRQALCAWQRVVRRAATLVSGSRAARN